MKLRLSDIYELQMGKTPARNTPAFWNGTNAWVSISDLTSSRKYISQTRECITDNAITRTGIKKIPKDTLLMSFKLSLGKVAITTTDIYTNEAIMAFIDKKKYDVDIHYMYHYFQAIDWTIGTNKAVKGITLNKRVLSEKVVDLPPINIQQEIAERMDNLNAVTENLQRQFMLLDELVKSQFVELFGNPNEMDKWPCCKVEDIADVTVGLVIKPTRFYTENAENGIKAFRSLNVREMYINDSDWVYFSPEGNEQNKKSQLQKGDVLVVRSGYPGTSCVVTDEYVGCNAIDIMLARPKKDKINPYYLCAFNNFPHGMNQIRHGTGGAAQKHFNVGAYNKVNIPVPPLELQNSFVEFMQLADKSKLVLRQLLEKQKTLKAALMQEYFS